MAFSLSLSTSAPRSSLSVGGELDLEVAPLPRRVRWSPPPPPPKDCPEPVDAVSKSSDGDGGTAARVSLRRKSGVKDSAKVASSEKSSPTHINHS